MSEKDLISFPDMLDVFIIKKVSGFSGMIFEFRFFFFFLNVIGCEMFCGFETFETAVQMEHMKGFSGLSMNLQFAGFGCCCFFTVYCWFVIKIFI